MALAAYAIENLHQSRFAANGPDQPSTPSHRFIGIASIHQREQSKGRVAQPAKPVIPIAGAAQLLRKRGGRRGDHSTARLKNQCAQGEQGADHRIRPFSGALEGLRPGGPAAFGLFERKIRIDGFGHILVGDAIAQCEIRRLPGGDDKLTDMGPAVRAKSYRRAQDQAIGTRDRLQTSIVEAAHPGHDRTIVETDNELGAELDAAADAAHKTHKMRARRSRRHEVDDDSDPISGLDRGVENQSMAAIVSRDLGTGVRRRDQPAAVILGAQEIGETSGTNQSAASIASPPTDRVRREPPSRNRR